jgi:hypothetical protein
MLLRVSVPIVSLKLLAGEFLCPPHVCMDLNFDEII